MRYEEKCLQADEMPLATGEALVQALRERSLRIATAESCTGGRLADAIVSVAGASEVFDGGVVSYANRIKQELIAVSPVTLATCGAVSAQCAAEMAQGVRERMHADLGLSTTGIAGPGGGSAEKPVGLVYVGVATAKRVTVYRLMLSGDRDTVRSTAVRLALTAAMKHV